MKEKLPWKTYRTRFLVTAKPLTSALRFVDALGREHRGEKGDYLVESDGVLRIAPRAIFEDVYVPVEQLSGEPNLPGAQSAIRKRPQSASGRRISPEHAGAI
jgi:hypothetical protein